MKVILLGAAGQLGSEFREFLQGKVELYPFSHQELDVGCMEKVLETFQDIKPEVVINCAAYTKVDQAEKEQEECYRVNALGARNVAYGAYRVGAKVVYVSTDYIFDGKRSIPYTEFDSPHPLSIYGRSKLWGEYFTTYCNPNYLIMRTSWLYGRVGQNFVKTVINLARKGEDLRIVDDQRGSPTFVGDAVTQAWVLLEKDRVGCYHSANVGEVTWYRLAQKVLAELKFQVQVVPIVTKEYRALAERPKYSVLRNFLLEMEGLNIMRPWDEALEDFLQKFKGESFGG